MKKAILFGLAIILILSACSTSRQKLSPQGNLDLKSANVYYTQKDNEKSLEKAYNLYNRVLADNPNHVIALKRTADINFFYASQKEPSVKEKDGIKEYLNMDNAKLTINYYVITYGKYDSVLTVLNTFKKLNENDRSLKRDAQRKKEGSWVRIFKIGQLLFDTKKYDDAISAFEITNKLDPSKQEPLRMLVASYQALKNDAKVELYMNKILAVNPEDAEIIRMMGSHYYVNKDYRKALEYLKKTMITAPLDTLNIMLVAESYYELKEYQPALDALNKILKLNPESIEALKFAKDVAMDMKNPTAEIDYMKRIVALEPSNENKTKYCYLLLQNKMYTDLLDFAELWYQKDNTSMDAVTFCANAANQLERKDLVKKYTDIYNSLQPK